MIDNVVYKKKPGTVAAWTYEKSNSVDDDKDNESYEFTEEELALIAAMEMKNNQSVDDYR